MRAPYVYPKRQPLAPTPCQQCGTPFTRKKNGKKRPPPKYCSAQCAYAAKTGKPAPGFVTPESDRRQRLAANGLVNKRFKLGWFTKPDRCVKCGKKRRVEAHHCDYSKPDEVHWLCRSCHMTAHHNGHLLDGIAPFVCDDKRKAVANGH